MMENSPSSSRSIDAGRVLAALGAIVLFVGLFLDWYSVGSPDSGDGVSAWTVFEVVDLLLAFLALATVLLVLDAIAPRSVVPAIPGAAIGTAGFVALVLVTTSLLNDPPAVSGAPLEEGIWISFAGALLMALGALLGRSRITLVVTPREAGQSPPADRDETDTQVLREH